MEAVAIDQTWITHEEYDFYAGYLKSKFGDYADSDIIHQALDKLVKGELTGEVPYIRRCLANKMKDLIKRDKRTEPFDPEKHEYSDDGDWQASTDAKIDLERFLSKLTRKERACVECIHLEYEDIEMVALEWGIAKQTVRNLASDGVKKMREMAKKFGKKRLLNR